MADTATQSQLCFGFGLLEGTASGMDLALVLIPVCHPRSELSIIKGSQSLLRRKRQGLCASAP